MDIDDLDALEGDVLDDLEANDDAAPAGTVPLSAARRRRALAEAPGPLDAS